MKRVNKVFSCILSVLLIASVFTTRVIAQGNNISELSTKFVELTVAKTWDHGNNPEESRPESINLTLKNDDTVVDTLTLDESKSWEGAFKRVPLYDAEGSKITYTVEEEKVEGYQTSISYTTSNTILGLPSSFFTKETSASTQEYNIGSSNIIITKDGNRYYIWTLSELSKSKLINDINAAIDDGRLSGFGAALTDENSKYVYGSYVTLTVEQGSSGKYHTIFVEANSDTIIRFSTTPIWSMFYHGSLETVEEYIKVDVTNVYIDEDPEDEEPGDEEPGDEEPGDEEDEDDEDDDEETEPTPTPTPTTTPTEPSEPTESPEPPESPEPTETPEPITTPIPFPRPTTTPEVEIDDEEIPGGAVVEDEGEIILDDEVIPGGDGQLPKTGELPPVVFYSTGSLIAAIGYKLRGKRKD